MDICLIEQAVTGAERYLAIMVDPASYGLRVIYATQGGVDIEQSAATQARLCPPHPASAVEVLADLVAIEAEDWRSHIMATRSKARRYGAAA